jgi:hypothetical protein
MDDLSHRVNDGFNRVDADFRALRGEMSSRFEHVDTRFDALQRTIIQIGGGMIATLVVGFASLLVAHA